MSNDQKPDHSVDAEKTLADHLREAASRSGLSVYRISKAAGVDQSTLNKFLKGDRANVRLDVADRLYRLFFHPPRRKHDVLR